MATFVPGMGRLPQATNIDLRIAASPVTPVSNPEDLNDLMADITDQVVTYNRRLGEMINQTDVDLEGMDTDAELVKWEFIKAGLPAHAAPPQQLIDEHDALLDHEALEAHQKRLDRMDRHKTKLEHSLWVNRCKPVGLTMLATFFGEEAYLLEEKLGKYNPLAKLGLSAATASDPISVASAIYREGQQIKATAAVQKMHIGEEIDRYYELATGTTPANRQPTREELLGSIRARIRRPPKDH